MGHTKTIFKSSTAIAIAILSGCGSDSAPAINHLTAVADPDPQTPFFNDSTMQSLNELSASSSSWIADLSKALPIDQAKASAPSNRARTIMAVDQTQLDCGSGNIRASGNNDPANLSATISFNKCANDGVVTNGAIRLNGAFREGSLETSYVSAYFNVDIDNLTLSGQESATIHGDIAIDLIENPQQFVLSVAGDALTTVADGQTNTLSNYQFSISEAQEKVSASLNMTLHNNQHGSLVLRTDSPLSSDINAEYPASGKLTLTHSDGSYLIIDADNGNPESFAYTIFNGSSSTSGNTLWTDMALLDSLDLSPDLSAL